MAYDELVEQGVLILTERVWLDRNGEPLYHNYFCQRSTGKYEEFILIDAAIELGYTPCPDCGGEGYETYITP